MNIHVRLQAVQRNSEGVTLGDFFVVKVLWSLRLVLHGQGR